MLVGLTTSDNGEGQLMSEPTPYEFAWVGSQEPSLDVVAITRCGPVVVGRYGGRRAAGAAKNEDGALVWAAANGAWEFAALIDAHFSAQSAALLVEMLLAAREEITRALAAVPSRAIPRVREILLANLSAPTFRARCQEVIGEASCFFAARTGRHLWWLSVGDVVGYLLHPESARLGSYALNQRSFFEWVGAHNTFDDPVPSFTQGTRYLFTGLSTILLTTDGLLEFGTQPFAQPEVLYRQVMGSGAELPPLGEAVAGALARIHSDYGRDSATILAWRIENGRPVGDEGEE